MIEEDLETPRVRNSPC